MSFLSIDTIIVVLLSFLLFMNLPIAIAIMMIAITNSDMAMASVKDNENLYTK